MTQKNLSHDDTFYIYTDASFDKTQGLGVSGYLFFKNVVEHEKTFLTEAHVILKTFNEKNNIRAEIRGAIEALEMISAKSGKFKVHLYTDCQTISKLSERRKKLEQENFISKSKNEPLANADLYKILFNLFDKLKPEIHWVKGHSPKGTKDLIKRNFSVLDKAVRKKLREST